MRLSFIYPIYLWLLLLLPLTAALAFWAQGQVSRLPLPSAQPFAALPPRFWGSLCFA